MGRQLRAAIVALVSFTRVPRVARARGLPEAVVRQFVAAHTVGRQLGVLGEPRVNVLTVNLALDGR